MDFDTIHLEDDIQGVHSARQKRSVRIRDAYIKAGIRLLNTRRFSEIRISDLAEDCGGSVGSFYTRFEDKDAFFRALRAAAIGACNREIHRRVNMDRLFEMAPAEALDELVDLMADIFTSPIRGVLRESLLRILEPDDPWAPMRDSARLIIRNYRRALAHEFPAFDPEETTVRLSFCFQLIVGTLQNDLVNDYHVFSAKDETLRIGLREALKAYMRLPLDEAGNG
ncbi:TetR/AcrR family transcriptional regulator [Chelatococcus asaccharovorans]|uniref:TetR family transcriptional regulator n=1 Tax=Chelatococcus asaccharovorans TaxID=28210 RepID=A0A2V3UGP6_9HYPH|nr:TetR/AcrR family transcriptional regulator [Chelatococcus asaccharovorans]MBS7701752.1 TetR/AcrR family transcriptional regulator [Chelatococcus asaccharovorans]PXW64542.1 TetR family transcriptional regulator [Chelatococcus asaccharovorans]CAH1665237.1 TetR family transcriptional regulator [Chelatococcus asaccharovorans]CAH1682049.1 TetR family transcriptional regulator [Chelatococcus asaccharovorans]